MSSITYNNKWILANWESYRNWSSLCKAYNKEFGTEIKYNTFKSHCNRELQLNFHYSKEEDEWLFENYPKLGRRKCAEAFNEKFCTNRTAQGIKNHCQWLGMRVTEERKKQMAIENSGNFHEVGTVVARVRGELFIKKEDGTWTQLSRYMLGDNIPKGCVVIFLDGNNQNLAQENLAIILRKHLAIMTKNKFWSECAEITRTGLVWCELNDVLKRKKVQDELYTSC